MFYVSRVRAMGCVSLAVLLGSLTAQAQQIKKVFVIAMENHNWTQPANQFAGGIQQIYLNPAAAFINSLVNGTAQLTLGEHTVNIGDEVSYAAAYHNVLPTPSGNNPHIHPSEPNYIWAEAGTNFGIANDADPYPNNLAMDAGKVINVVRPESQWTVPLTSLSGGLATTRSMRGMALTSTTMRRSTIEWCSSRTRRAVGI